MPGVQLWRLALVAVAEDLRACAEVLSAEERQKAERYRVERPRSNFILSRGTLRFLLGERIGIKPQALRFRYAEYGKPLLDEPGIDLHFNVSHTEGVALIGIADCREIGVDVERILPSTEARKLSERFFSVREREFLQELSGEELQTAFFRCWTRKEAYIKARGEGLSLPLDQFDVSVAPGETQALLATRPDNSEAARWMVRDISLGPEYAGALALATTVNPEASKQIDS